MRLRPLTKDEKVLGGLALDAGVRLERAPATGGGNARGAAIGRQRGAQGGGIRPAPVAQAVVARAAGGAGGGGGGGQASPMPARRARTAEGRVAATWPGGTWAPRRPVHAPAGPGGAITINGMQVPKEKVLVFLHIGHSNMAGRVTTPESLRPFNFETHPQLWSYARGGTFRPGQGAAVGRQHDRILRRRGLRRAARRGRPGDVDPAGRAGGGARQLHRLDRPRAVGDHRRLLPQLPQGRAAVRLRHGARPWS